jgi:hypothetical protein
MKNLFIINEDERKRILGLHENATKKQYLGEAKITGDQYSGRNIKFDSEDPITQSIFNLVHNVSDIDETKLVKEILKIKDKNTFVKINNELKNVFKMMGSKYTGLDSVIADAMDYDYDQYDTYKVLEPHLKKIGINTDRLGYDDYVFKNLPTNTSMAANPDQNKKTDTLTPAQREMSFASKYGQTYPCVVGGTKLKYTKNDGGFYYKLGDVAYYINGEYKNLTTGSKGTFKCNGKQISLDGKTTANPDVTPKQRVVPTTSDELLQGKGYLKLNDKNDLVKLVQNQLISAGETVTPSGIFDKTTYDAVKSFQSKQTPPLKTDGIVGKGTWLILSKVKSEMMTPKEVTLTNPQQNSSTTNDKSVTSNSTQPTPTSNQPDEAEG